MSKKQLTPHDSFLRAMMSDPKVAREFFDVNLPASIKEAVDLSTLQPQKDSFVADTLKLQIADLLFTADINGEEGYFYFLAEHQSTPQKMMPFRILKYMIAIQEQHLKKYKTDTLPFVYPILMYNGKSEYPYSMDLFDLFGTTKDMAREVWTNPYQLIDLTQVDDEELKKYLYFGTMAFMAKHIRAKEMTQPLFEILDNLKKLDKYGEISYIEIMISYIFKAGETKDKRDFVQQLAKELTSMDEEHIMTIADEFRLEGKLESAKSMLENGISPDLVLKCTGITQMQLEDLQQNRH